MAHARRGEEHTEATTTDVDRYPKAVDVLRRIIQEAELPEGPIERIEVTCLAGGDATYRVWEARALESEGGYFPPK